MSKNQSTYSAVMGTIIANERKRRMLEQADIAKNLGITQASYSRLESGHSVINCNQLFQIAEKLGMNASSLIAQVESAISSLKDDGVHVDFQGRAGNAKSNDGAGTFIAGAALGALLMGLFTSNNNNK